MRGNTNNKSKGAGKVPMRTETQKAEPWAFEDEVFESTEELVQKSLRQYLLRNDQMSHATEEKNAGEGITEYTIKEQAFR